MAFLRRIFKDRKKATAKKAKEKQKPKKLAEPKPVVSEARILAEGAVDYPAFVKACNMRGIKGNERIIQHFEQLYNWYSQSPALSALEAELELGAKIKNEAFDEAIVWADIMMANRLQASKKISIPQKYVETYLRITGKKPGKR